MFVDEVAWQTREKRQIPKRLVTRLKLNDDEWRGNTMKGPRSNHARERCAVTPAKHTFGYCRQRFPSPVGEHYGDRRGCNRT